jgi:hypothetical protein
MKRLAIFVEGLTEQMLVRHLIRTVLCQNKIAMQTVKITGGHNVRMSVTVITAAHIEKDTEYYVLIYDCGGESNVKGYLMAHYEKLVSSGYGMLIGLRDVYPNFTREQVDKLLYGLNFGLPRKKITCRIFLAIMETEAWFLGEYHHLKKVSRVLTPEFVQRHLGFNPRTGNMEERENPAADLKAAYRLAGHDYTKKRDRINAVISKLDLKYFTGDLTRRSPSLGLFVEALDRFFSP